MRFNGKKRSTTDIILRKVYSRGLQDGMRKLSDPCTQRRSFPHKCEDRIKIKTSSSIIPDLRTCISHEMDTLYYSVPDLTELYTIKLARSTLYGLDR